MNNYGQFAASQFLSPAQPLEVTTGVNAGGFIRIVNNSPYMLNINFNGVGSYIMPEMFLEDFPVGNSYLGKVTITPQINLTNVSHATSNLITIAMWMPGELKSPQAQPLNQQAVTATATGKPIFSATFGVGSTVGSIQTLNIFNPPTSGVNMTFHSARAFTNDNSIPAANLLVVNGSDLNLPTSVPAVSHNAQGTPPVSAAHCTADDSNTGHGGTAIEVMDMQQNVTQDVLDFPDNVTLAPGNNLRIAISSATTGHVVRFTMKWSEDIFTPQLGGVNLGTIANQIINEGNPLQPIVQATKQGDTPEDVLINNDGTALLAGILTLIAGLKTNTIRDNTAGAIALDLVTSGTVHLPGGKIQAGSTNVHLVGTTAGSIDMYQDFTGDIKRVILVFNGYRNATATPQVMALPSPFTKGAQMMIGNINATMACLAASVAQNINHYSNGAQTVATSVTAGNTAECATAFDSVSFVNSGASPTTCIVTLLGF